MLLLDDVIKHTCRSIVSCHVVHSFLISCALKIVWFLYLLFIMYYYAQVFLLIWDNCFHSKKIEISVWIWQITSRDKYNYDRNFRICFTICTGKIRIIIFDTIYLNYCMSIIHCMSLWKSSRLHRIYGP